MSYLQSPGASEPKPTEKQGPGSTTPDTRFGRTPCSPPPVMMSDTKDILIQIDARLSRDLEVRLATGNLVRGEVRKSVHLSVVCVPGVGEFFL